MKTKMDNFPAINPNPVLSVNKVGTVLYSNEASEPLLKEWGGEIGEKLPSSIADIVHRVITRNNPEKIEVKVGKRVYLLTFHPVSKEECVNIYGFDISEQKELEEKLRESEERYRAFFNTSAVGTAEIDLTGRLTKVNDRFCQITGYSHKELLRMKILELSHPDDRDNDSKNLVDYLNGRTSTLDIEKRYVRKDGRVIWVEVTAAIVCSLEGRPLRSMGVIQDITKRKKAEEALKEAYDSLEMKVKERTDELEEAQRIARIGNWSWNIASDEAHWSDEMYRIFGRDPQKLAPPYIEYLNYVHPDDREHADNAHKEALSGKSFSMDHRIILPNGEERTIHMKTEVIFSNNNIPIKLKGTVQDITERKKAEEKIWNLANIVESSSDAIGTMSLDGVITSWNKESEKIYGYSSKEIIGKAGYILTPPHLHDEPKKLIEMVKQGKKVHNYETSRLRKDGKIIDVSLNLSPVINVYGKLTAVSVIARDITESKRIEEALKNFEIARKKEIHHRIKNNLQVISSLLDLQADLFKGRKNITDSEVLKAFKQSIDRVISIALVHEELYKGKNIELLNFSQYIKELAENLLLTYKLDIDVNLNFDLEENIFLDMDTAIPLGIIINELVTNSFKYAFSGMDNGEIIIKFHVKGKEESKSGDFASTAYVLSVSDNGIGISKDLDFENLDSLGMQLITTLAEQLDGELELKRNSGTEFVIRFTVTEDNN